MVVLVPAVFALAAEGANAAAPRLRIDDACAFYPHYGDRPLLLIGASDRQALTLWKNDKGFDWRRYLDDLQGSGFNYVRQDVTAWRGVSASAQYPAQFSQPAWAFARTGPGVAADGRPKFDLTRFDDAYFRERMVPFLEETARRGIIVELTLFEDCRSRRAFEDSVYATGNNVNGLGLAAGTDPHADDALDNRRLLAIQENYAAHVIASTRQFGNVTYEVANETGGRKWVAHFVDFVHGQLPGALVSAGEQSSAYDPVAGRCDLVVKHRGEGGGYVTDEDLARHRSSLMAFRRGNKPVLHNEFFLYANRATDDANFARKMFWADFTGGGHANFYDFSWWRGTGRTMQEGRRAQAPPPEIMNGAKHLRRFVEEGRIPFWAMAPRDEIGAAVAPNAVRPFILAQPGKVYVVYMPKGGEFSLDLSAEAGVLTGRWFDPRAGRFGEAFAVEGGGRRTFRTPTEEDWALCLRR